MPMSWSSALFFGVLVPPALVADGRDGFAIPSCRGAFYSGPLDRYAPAENANLSFRADHSRTHRTLALARVLAFMVAILKPRSRAEDEIVPPYQGYSRCDSTERKLNHDIAGRIMRL